MNLEDLKPHELSNLFPLMAEDSKEFLELAADIAQNGLKERITTLNGLILDGRNRYRACRLAGLHLTADDIVIFEEEEAFVNEDPFKFVVSKNLHRRHLSDDQRSMIAAKLFQRMPKQKTGPKIISSQKCAEIPGRGERLSKAASAAQVNASAVSRAASVLNADPELASEVETGGKTVGQATEELRRKKTESKYISDDQKLEAEDRIEKVCGNDFWCQMMKPKGGKWAGLKTKQERVAFADRPDQEMKKISGAMRWGDWSVVEGTKFVTQKLGKDTTKEWTLADFFALMGEETRYQEKVATRYESYTITIERFVSKKQREAQRSGSAKGGTNHE
jgi:hypothetical protein